MWELVSNDKLLNDCELLLERHYMWHFSGAYSHGQFADNSIDMDTLFEGDKVFEIVGLPTNTQPVLERVSVGDKH